MRAVFSRQLKKEFHRMMLERFLEFTKIGTETGGVVYRSSNRGTYTYVLLWPHSKIDSFTLELAASDEPHYPLALLPGDCKPNACRFRIHQFISEPKGGWWHINNSHETDMNAILRCEETIDEDALRIPELVTDAATKLSQALESFAHQNHSTSREIR